MTLVNDDRDNLLGDELQGLTVDCLDALVRFIAARVAAEVESLPQRRLLSKGALADHYGVLPRTVKTWREKGCPALRVGRVLMFDVDTVNLWLEREG